MPKEAALETRIVTIYNSPSCLIVLSATFKSAALSALGMAVAKTLELLDRVVLLAQRAVAVELDVLDRVGQLVLLRDAVDLDEGRLHGVVDGHERLHPALRGDRGSEARSRRVRRAAFADAGAAPCRILR